jgi:hypothetical protein
MGMFGKGVGVLAKGIGSTTPSFVIEDFGDPEPPPLHPFFVQLFRDGSAWKYRVIPGTVNSKVPTLNDVRIDTPEPLTPVGTIGESGFVFIECTHEDGENFPVTAKIEFAEALPPDTDEKCHIALASFELAGGRARKLGQFVETSLWAERLKCGTNTAEYYVSRS